VTRPAGRAAVEIVGDASRFARQVQADTDKALRQLNLDVRPISDQLARGFEAGATAGGAALKTLSRTAAESFHQIDQAGETAFKELAGDARAAAAIIGAALESGTDGLDDVLAEELTQGLTTTVAAAETLGEAAAEALGKAVDAGISGVGAEAAREIIASITVGLIEARPLLLEAGHQMGSTVAEGAGTAGAPRARSSGIAIATAMRTGLLAGSAAIVTGLATLTALGLESAGSLEQTQISLQSLTGSVQAGQKAFKDLQAFAASTPFEFPQVTTVAQQFLAFSHSIGMSQRDMIPFLSTLGDVASITGAGAEGMQRVANALGQISSAGRLTVGDVRQVATNLPGFNAVAAIAAARGESTAQALDEISKGAIPADEGIRALLQGMKAFPGAAGAMEKQSQTLLGVFSTFKDVSRQALSDAFAGVIPQIKDSLGKITPIIGETFSKLAPALGAVVAQLLPFLTSLLQGLTPILVPILNALAQGLAKFGPSLTVLGQAIGVMVESFAPILVPLGQLAAVLAEALAPGLTALAEPLDGIATLFDQLVQAVGPVLTILGDVLGAILEPLGFVGDILKQVGAALGPVIVAIGQAFAPVLQLIGPLLTTLITALTPLLPIFVALSPPLVQLVTALQPLILVFAQLLTIGVQIAAPFLQLASILIEFLASKAIAPLLGLIAQGLAFILQPVGLLVPLLDSFGKWLQGINWGAVGKAIGGAFVDAWHAVSSFFVGIWHWFASIPDMTRQALANLQAFFRGIGERMWEGLRRTGSAIGDFFAGIGRWFASLPGLIGHWLAQLPGQLWAALKRSFDQALVGVGVLIGLLMAEIIAAPKLIMAALVDFPKAVLAWLGHLFTSALDLTVSSLKAVGSAIADGVMWLGRTLVRGVKDAVDLTITAFMFAVHWLTTDLPALLGRAMTAAGDAIRHGISAALAAVWQGIQFVAGLVRDGTNAAADFLVALPGRIWAALSALPGIIGRAFSAAFQWAKNEVMAGVAWVTNMIHSIPDRIAAIKDKMAAAGRAIISGFMSGLRAVGGFVSDVAGDIVRAVKGFLNTVIRHLNEGIAKVDDALPFSLPRIPQLAKGGLTQSAGLAMLHPTEVVLPLEDARTTDLLSRAIRDANASLAAVGVPGAGMGDIYIDLSIGDQQIRDVVATAVDEHNRALKIRVLAGAGRAGGRRVR
jgi:tape measure domain-containing protein